MAGGMYRGRAGPSLADRAASSGVPPDPGRAPSAEREPEGTSSEPPPPRHFVPPPPPVGPRRPAEQAPGQPAQRPAARGTTVAAAHGRHCWVRDPPDAPGVWPGLLVEWRQREDGWHGRVAYAVPGVHGPVLVEAWLPAEQLKQG